MKPLFIWKTSKSLWNFGETIIEILNSWIYQRFTRNEYLMNFATKFFSRIIENLWSWIIRINSLCEQFWYPKPTYSIDNNELKVTYFISKKS